MAGQSPKQRKMTTSGAEIANGLFTGDPVRSANEEDKKNWRGFCEIESEPAFFNTMLRSFGVDGIKVQEVVSLEPEMLAFLPRPIFGLIFLFRWMEDDPDKSEQSCPEGIWFANQTSHNSCASVALLNIVNNIPGIELGENLRKFKHFTGGFSPALRGDAINNFQFIKEIHNSFARKMDMLNADLLLKNESDAKSKGKKARSGEDNCAAGFHFIAFMPIAGSLWKLDGLERQPVSLGSVSGDWLAQATPDIKARMAQYEQSQIEFAILSLVKDPLISLWSALAENVQDLVAVESRLDVIEPGWRSRSIGKSKEAGGHGMDEVLTGPDAGLELTKEHILLAQTNKKLSARLLTYSSTEAITAREELILAQQSLRMAIQDEIQSKRSEEERALSRTRDFGASMQIFARKVKSRQLS